MMMANNNGFSSTLVPKCPRIEQLDSTWNWLTTKAKNDLSEVIF